MATAVSTRINPAVSILLPAFDAEATLSTALKSVQRQSFRNWACVIVDDGSTDATGAIARRFADSDPRFGVVRRHHAGLVASLNAGLAHCAAPFTARMDADDIMHRHRLAAQLRYLERRPELDAIGCHVRLFPRAILGDGIRRYEAWLNSIDGEQRLAQEAFVECPIAHPTWLVRTDVLSRFGYRDRGWAEDYDLLLRLLAAGRRLGVLPERLLSWRDGPTRMTRTSAACSLERLTACKAAFIASGLLAHTDRYVLWGYGRTAKALHRALAALGKRASHIVEVHPGRIGNRIHGAPVIAWQSLADIEHGPIVASVLSPAGRTEIRAALDGKGYREAVDYVCAA